MPNGASKADVLQQILSSHSYINDEDAKKIIKEFEETGKIKIKKLADDGYYLLAAILQPFIRDYEPDVVFMKLQKVSSNLGKAMTIIKTSNYE